MTKEEKLERANGGDYTRQFVVTDKNRRPAQSPPKAENQPTYLLNSMLVRHLPHLLKLAVIDSICNNALIQMLTDYH